jgi:ParB/RepB/Spo0J family partition protein
LDPIPVQSIDSWQERLGPDPLIDDMVNSLSLHGQLSPIRVRKHPTLLGRYEAIFGNRRLAAAKLLGWKTIAADIVSVSNQDALIMAFCENEDRKDLCDYERACFLERIHEATGKSYVEISQLIGKSPAYVSQHVAMLNLFPKTIAPDDEIRRVLCSLTESHARTLTKIENLSERWSTAKFAISANLSVRELQKFCSRASDETKTNGKESKDKTLRQIIVNIIEGFNVRDMGPYEESLSDKYFSTVVVLPQFRAMDAENAKTYVHKILSKVTHFRETIEDLDIKFFSELAIATLGLIAEASYSGRSVRLHFRATIVFQHDDTWKIIHEHWSADDTRGFSSLFDGDGELAVKVRPRKKIHR